MLAPDRRAGRCIVTQALRQSRLTPFGEQFYRENWQRYRELYPEVDAPAPDASTENTNGNVN